MTRIKVQFYGTFENAQRRCYKVTFTTLEEWKRKVSPTLYAQVAESLKLHGQYSGPTHRVKIIE